MKYRWWGAVLFPTIAVSVIVGLVHLAFAFQDGYPRAAWDIAVVFVCAAVLLISIPAIAHWMS